MQLRVARLCHDCEEIHADQQCPVCASETFTFITRWVPAPERRKRPRPATSPEAEIYRQITGTDSAPGTTSRLVKRAAVGLTAVGIAGWLWGRTRQQQISPASQGATGDEHVGNVASHSTDSQ